MLSFYILECGIVMCGMTYGSHIEKIQWFRPKIMFMNVLCILLVKPEVEESRPRGVTKVR